MKKILIGSLLIGTTLFGQNKFIQKYGVSLEAYTNQNVLKEISNLNKELKNNKECKINENIKYLSNNKYPYQLNLTISCNVKDAKDITKIKEEIKKIVDSKDIKILEYSTQTYQASEEYYKNEKDFLAKHKDIAEMLNRLTIIQNEMQEEMKKNIEYMQKLFNN